MTWDAFVIVCLSHVCSGSQGIPADESQIATDLYDGLQAFFAQHKDLQQRPFFITGESYAGKYVPAIGELC